MEDLKLVTHVTAAKSVAWIFHRAKPHPTLQLSLRLCLALIAVHTHHTYTHPPSKPPTRESEGKAATTSQME